MTDEALITRLTGFTPGPWKLKPGKDAWLGGFYAGDFEVCTFGVDTTYYPTAGDAPNHWNAALMIAAPDLHRIALERGEEIERLRAALEWVQQNGNFAHRNNILGVVNNALAVKP